MRILWISSAIWFAAAGAWSQSTIESPDPVASALATPDSAVSGSNARPATDREISDDRTGFLDRASVVDLAPQADARSDSRADSAPLEMFRKGVDLVDQGAIEQAKIVFQALTLTYPELPEPHINLAVLLAATGGAEAAAAEAEAAILAHPVCKAAFDLEFQRQMGGYSTTFLAARAPVDEEPAPRLIGLDERQWIVREDLSSCLNFRSQPATRSLALDCLHPGTGVRVLEAVAQWSRVALEDGSEGWVSTPFLAPTPRDEMRIVGERAVPCLNFRSRPELDSSSPDSSPPDRAPVTSTALECLPPGSRVRQLAVDGEWARVALEDGREGWMAVAFLSPVGVSALVD